MPNREECSLREANGRSGEHPMVDLLAAALFDCAVKSEYINLCRG